MLTVNEKTPKSISTVFIASWYNSAKIDLTCTKSYALQVESDSIDLFNLIYDQKRLLGNLPDTLTVPSTGIKGPDYLF
jgi:hypothetical protein